MLSKVLGALLLILCSTLREIWSIMNGKIKQVAVVTFRPKDSFWMRWFFKPQPIVRRYILAEERFSIFNWLPWTNFGSKIQDELKLAIKKPRHGFLVPLFYDTTPEVEEITVKEEEMSFSDVWSWICGLFRITDDDFTRSLNGNVNKPELLYIDFSFILNPIISILVCHCLLVVVQTILR